MNILMAKDEKYVTTKVKWIDIFLCAVAFLMARIGIGDTFYTVGVAYVGVLFMSKSLRLWSWLFATCGILSLTQFSVSTLKYIFMLALVVAMREYMLRTGSRMGIKNQSLVVGVAIIVVNMIAGMVEGIDTYTVIIGILEGAVGGAICYLLSEGVNVLRQHRKTPLITKETVSMIFIFSCLLGGFLDFYLKEIGRSHV